MASPVSSFPAVAVTTTVAPGQRVRTDAAAQGVQAQFRPGIEAPRVKVQAPVQQGVQPQEHAQASSTHAAAASPLNSDNRQFFTLQALSAYAGMIIGEDLPQGLHAQARSASATGASASADGANTPPPSPGSLFDLKI